MKKWVDSLESSFCYTDAEAKGAALQHLRRSTSYNLLSELQKQLFLDIAFYLPEDLGAKGEILELLHLVHRNNIQEVVGVSERRGLIDLSGLTLDKSRSRLMHDLYYEMATIVEEKGSECLFLHSKQFPIFEQFKKIHCENIKRICFKNCHFGEDLVIKNFPCLEVLAIVDCEGVKKTGSSRGILST